LHFSLNFDREWIQRYDQHSYEPNDHPQIPIPNIDIIKKTKKQENFLYLVVIIKIWLKK